MYEALYLRLKTGNSTDAGI
jgi:broad specificity phosphatase PhoE